MSVANAVKSYIEQRPYLQEALAHEIVNFSAISRVAQDDIEGSFEAIKMAFRRQAEELKDRRGTQAEHIGEVLAGTSIELKSNMAACKRGGSDAAVVTATTKHGRTWIQSAEAECEGQCITDQVLITLDSPRNLEDTPGVVAYLLSILAGHDINVTELVSCREDTHIVIHEDDATTAFEVLTEKLR